MQRLVSGSIIDNWLDYINMYNRYSTYKVKVATTSIVMLFFFTPVVSNVNAQEFDEWKKEHKGEFQDFKDKRDVEFLKMLEEVWVQVDGIETKPTFEDPKIENIPRAEGSLFKLNTSDGKENEERVTVKKLTGYSKPNELVAGTNSLQSNSNPTGSVASELIFYDVKVPFYYFPNNIVKLQGSPNKDALKTYWEEMSKTEYNLLLDRLSLAIQQMNLNDWGVFNLSYKLGEDIYGNSENNIRLFVWFMMTKLGYEIKTGFNTTQVYLLMPSKNRISNTSFFTLKGRRYYVFDTGDIFLRPGRLTTYDGQYPNSNKTFSLSANKIPVLPDSTQMRNVRFTWEKKEYSFDVPYNKNIIDYYRRFPTSDLHIYTMAENSNKTLQALHDNLGTIIKEKSPEEALNILLRFVQTAFKYKTDVDQFGKQKFMLPEEIFYYSYSDCDDRAILFAFLVNHLLGYDVIGLRYPGHLATAVNIKNTLQGDSFTYNGKKYVVADPTYINSTLGMSMPKFRRISPEITNLFY